MPTGIPTDSLAAGQVMHSAGLIPQVPYPGARQKWPCRCVERGHNVAPTYDNVRSGRSTGCRWCAHETGSRARSAAGEAKALALAFKCELEPIGPYSGMTAPWPCRCKRCNTELAPRPTDLKRQKFGCKTCAMITQSARQLAPEVDAVDTLRAAGWEPQERYPGVMRPWRSRCLTCDWEASPLLNAIKNGGFGRCRGCVQNDAVTLARSVQLEPLESFPGVEFPWKCRCLKCGRTVRPHLANFKYRTGAGGCRWCSNRGFNAVDAAIVYLITHRAYGAAKIGIGNADRSRVDSHLRRGWQLLALERVTGERALEIEENVLTWWRIDLGLPQFLGKQEMPQRGWTETVELDMIDIPATIERIKQLAAT